MRGCGSGDPGWGTGRRGGGGGAGRGGVGSVRRRMELRWLSRGPTASTRLTLPIGLEKKIGELSAPSTRYWLYRWGD